MKDFTVKELRYVRVLGALCMMLAGCPLEGGPVIGHAGGYVFYDKGSYSDGWRYLEAAPAAAEFRAAWGAYEKNVSGTKYELGSGKQNTKLIVDFLQQIGETGKAAQRCASLDTGGFADWFLPNEDELSLMSENLLLKKNPVSLRTKGDYWSSSQYDSKRAWPSIYDDKDKRSDKYVRAIRTF